MIRLKREMRRSSRRLLGRPTGPAPLRVSGQSSLRLPQYFHLEVLRVLSCELAPWLPPESVASVARLVRARDEVRLTDGTLGDLQSINRLAPTEWLQAAALRQIGCLLSKYEGLKVTTPAQRKADCIRRLIAVDQSLKIAAGLTEDPVFLTAKRLILEWIGREPDMEELSKLARHGPGSSTVHKFSDRSLIHKISEWPYVCTPLARAHLTACIKADPRWVGALEDSYRQRYRIEPWRILNQDAFWANVINAEDPSNRVTCVPKDATKDRTIAIEPPGNVYLQLGLDGYIRRALREAGNSIDDQDRNRAFALEGSLLGTVSTIDLSDASDTVSMELVEALFPEGWVKLLSELRSKYGRIPDGTAWRYAKLSSMGNGGTFVVETLIFLAVARAVSFVYGDRSDRPMISVYGDDIVVPTYLYRQVRAYLEAFGFKPNATKSFHQGPVRESCGVDAFNGVNIRPVFWKRTIRDELDLYALRNRLNGWWLRILGAALPCSLDQLFFRYLKAEPLFGPVSQQEFEGWIHDEAYTAYVGTTWYAYQRLSKVRKPHHFLFGRLMHDLRDCSSEAGTRFQVGEETRKIGVCTRVTPP